MQNVQAGHFDVDPSELASQVTSLGNGQVLATCLDFFSHLQVGMDICLPEMMTTFKNKEPQRGIATFG